MSHRISRNREFLENFITESTTKRERKLLISSKASDDQIASIVELLLNLNSVDQLSLSRKQKNCLRKI